MSRPPSDTELERIRKILEKLRETRDIPVPVHPDALQKLYGDDRLYNGGNGRFRRRFEDSILIRAAGIQSLVFQRVFMGRTFRGRSYSAHRDRIETDAFRLSTVFRTQAIIGEMERRGLNDKMPPLFRDSDVHRTVMTFGWPS